MIAVEFLPIFTILGSLAFAVWCKREIGRFAERVNRQIYEEYASLVKPVKSYADFAANSRLQPKQTVWANAFVLLFPLTAYFVASPPAAFLLMTLLFLALLDCCYYLTDIRGIAVIFVLSLTLQPSDGGQESLLFCILLFGGLTFFYRRFLNKEALGTGDSLLFVALAPKFSVENMLLLIFTAAASGLIYSLLYRALARKKLEKLPFIPFIAFSTFTMIVGRISAPFSG